jgi:hypothetical protein
MRIWFSDACCALMAPEMVISNPVTHVQRLYCRPDNIKSDSCFHIHTVHGGLLKFQMFQNRADSRSAFNSAEPRLEQQLQGLIYRIVGIFELQNGKETQWFSTQERAGQPVFLTKTSRSPETFFKCRMY